MPWSFIPQQETVMVMPGEPTLVFYKAVSNQSTNFDHSPIGQYPYPLNYILVLHI